MTWLEKSITEIWNQHLAQLELTEPIDRTPQHSAGQLIRLVSKMPLPCPGLEFKTSRTVPAYDNLMLFTVREGF